MIFGDLRHSNRIEPLHPLFKTAFDYIKTHDLLNTELGRIELKGDTLFINNVETTCVKAEEQVLEAHKQYIDIHVVLSATETIGWKPTDTLTTITQEYNKEADCLLSSDQATSYTTLQPNQFAIVYPEDAHAPLIGEGTLRKLIVKIKL